MVPELARALTVLLAWLRKRYGEELDPNLPLFPSRNFGADGKPKAITRYRAHQLFLAVFERAGIENDGRLGTHSLRKTFARKVYQFSGNDLMVLKAALNHSEIATTEKYLEVDEAAVEAAIAKCDFTRPPRIQSPELKQASA